MRKVTIDPNLGAPRLSEQLETQGIKIIEKKTIDLFQLEEDRSAVIRLWSNGYITDTMKGKIYREIARRVGKMVRE